MTVQAEHWWERSDVRVTIVALGKERKRLIRVPEGVMLVGEAKDV